MSGAKLRLVVDEVDVRRSAGHEEINDAFGPGRVMQRAQDAGARGRVVGPAKVAIEQRRQRGDADPAGGAAEELAAGLQKALLRHSIHLSFPSFEAGALKSIREYQLVHIPKKANAQT